jgi:hypothetical protein
MIILWTVVGVILGWMSVEVLTSMTKMFFSSLINIGMAFVGGVIAYTWVSGGLNACMQR